jgi:predicted metal-dependent enzyme (double-stranded beta helix superfamily)
MDNRISRRGLLAAAAGLALSRSAAARSATGRSPDFDVEQFIDDVRRARNETDGQKTVEDVLQRAVSDSGAVLDGLGEPQEVGIHTLYRADDLTILNVVWAPYMVLLPHNHGMWASIGIYTGREDNILWGRSGSTIEARNAASLSEQEVFSLPQDAIHSVINPIPRLTGAIHIYGGDFFATPRSEWDSDTLHERPFDLDRARKTFQEANERFKRSQ